MKNSLFTPITIIFIGLSSMCYGNSMNGSEANSARGEKVIQNQTFAFTENKGQIKQTDGADAPYVRYLLQHSNTNIYLLREGGIAYQFNRMHFPEGYKAAMNTYKKGDAEDLEKMMTLEEEVQLETYRMNMHLVNANPNAEIISEGKSADYVNYYTHDVLNVHQYERLTYKDIYPGIDWVIYTNEEGFKYDFVVHPGAAPNQIQLSFTYQEELYLDEGGNLIHGNPMGSFTEKAPVSFQNSQSVPTHFVLEGNTLSFALGEYDPNQTLTIDPARVWGTYYGGNDADGASSCVVDGQGNVYLAGVTQSTSEIAFNGHQMTHANPRNSPWQNSDVFLVKFNSSGVRQWATYYGGVESDNGNSLAIDGNNNVYLAGATRSTSGISDNGHQNNHGGGNSDAFLVKFNNTGVREWATYYGGDQSDFGYSCAVDGNDNVYLTGNTSSTSGIADNNGHQNIFGSGGSDAFIAKFNSNGVRQWASYYGGSGWDIGLSCAIDGSNNVYLSGQTTSTNGIADNGHQNTFGGLGTMNFDGDAFLVKFNSNGAREWGTYYGGSDDDGGAVCAVDGSDNVFLAGSTISNNGIAHNGHQNTHGNPGIISTNLDGFLVKFNSNGVRQWGTYYGGDNHDTIHSCVVDGSGNVYLTGATASTNGISFNGHQNVHAGGYRDAFLVKFNNNGVRHWGTYYGDNNYDAGSDCAVDDSGYVYLAGTTLSTTGIASNGHQNTMNGDNDAFLVKFHGAGTISVNHYAQNNHNIEVYPNPTQGTVRIALPEGTAGQSLTMIDTKGQVVKSLSVESDLIALDMSDLANGVYFVRVNTAKGVLTKKIIKN